nr:PepSY domain-containing protein [Nocardioides flavescens]
MLDVPVDYEAAAQAASSAGGTGEPTGLELDEDNGTATWEVQYGEDTGTETTVRVDAQSGEVTGTENDD